MRLRFICTVIVLAVLLVSCAREQRGLVPEKPSITNSMNLNQPPEAVWSKIMQFLALKSISPTVMDKGNGNIFASGPSKPGGIIDCSENKGKLADFQYKLSISVDKTGTGTRVTVMLSGEANILRRRHFLFFRTSTVKTSVSCKSTGILENELFSFLEQQ